MQPIKYMSMVFRGVVEEYENNGVRPSVFMDSAGDLQIYLCDAIVDDPEENVEEEMNFEANGGQFPGFMELSFNVHYNKIRSGLGEEHKRAGTI